MEYQNKYAHLGTAKKEEAKLSPEEVLARRASYEYSRKKRDSQQVTTDYETYTYKGYNEDGSLFRVFFRHKKTGRIDLTFAQFMALNPHIDKNKEVAKGTKINFPKGTKVVSHSQLLQDTNIKKSYAQYLTQVKKDLQTHEHYTKLGAKQKAKIDGVALKPAEQKWIAEKEDEAASIKHLRYIVVPHDTVDLISKKTGFTVEQLQKLNIFPVKSNHQSQTVVSAHPGDSIILPATQGRMFIFNFPAWRKVAEHKGALMSDMDLDPFHIHYFQGKDEKRHSVKMPVVWIHPYTLAATDWTNKAHEFIYSNYGELKSKATGNMLEIGIGNSTTGNVMVYKYQHQKPSANTAITAHFDSLENYANVQEQNKASDQAGKDAADAIRKKKETKKLQKQLEGFKLSGSTDIGSFFRFIGASLENILINEGSKVKFTVDVAIPIYGVLKAGFAIKIEAEKTGGNIK